MKNSLDRFFQSDRLLYTMPWIYAVATLSLEIIKIAFTAVPSYFYLGLEIMSIFLIFGITVSYKLHEKNIMKTLFGALMMAEIIYFFYGVCYYFGNDEYIFSTVAYAVITLLYIIFFINHLVLGYGHKANPARMNMNRVIGALIVLSLAVGCAQYFTSLPLVIYNIIVIATEAATVIEILCIETKVDAYKVIREKQININGNMTKNPKY